MVKMVNGIFSDHKPSPTRGWACFFPRGYTFLFPVIRINLQVLAVRWDNFALVDPVSPNGHGNLRKSAHIPGINGKNGAMEFSLIIKPYVTGYAAGETRL